MSLPGSAVSQSQSPREADWHIPTVTRHRNPGDPTLSCLVCLPQAFKQKRREAKIQMKHQKITVPVQKPELFPCVPANSSEFWRDGSTAAYPPANSSEFWTDGSTAVLCCKPVIRVRLRFYRSDNLCVAPDTRGQENCPSNRTKSSLALCRTLPSDIKRTERRALCRTLVEPPRKTSELYAPRKILSSINGFYPKRAEARN
jgi:hypothetical protein